MTFKKNFNVTKLEIARTNSNNSNLSVTLKNASYVCPTCEKEILCDIHWSSPINFGKGYYVSNLERTNWHAESVEPLEVCECTESLAHFDPNDTAPMPSDIKEEVRKFIDELEK